MTNLGQTVMYQITGFSGIATGRCEYITGCHQILVQPVQKQDGTFVEARWMDEDRLVIVSAEPIVLKVVNPGPCESAPIR